MCKLVLLSAPCALLAAIACSALAAPPTPKTTTKMAAKPKMASKMSSKKMASTKMTAGKKMMAKTTHKKAMPKKMAAMPVVKK